MEKFFSAQRDLLDSIQRDFGADMRLAIASHPLFGPGERLVMIISGENHELAARVIAKAASLNVAINHGVKVDGTEYSYSVISA